MLAWLAPAIANDNLQWIVIALAAFTIFYVVFRPMMKRKKDPLSRMPTFSLAQQRSVEQEMQNLLVELSRMAQQVSAQIDTRAARLQVLMDEAEKTIARLEKARAAGAAAPGDVPAVADAPAKPMASPLDARYAEIYAMADGGKNAQEIAVALDRPRGEIELILALRR